ncbi:VWA domain-containing protein [Thermus parvatiensis]|uniref:VWA domain-containing protein n=1 Tax=Thermus parvatiensis TaxID=456163 RepID=UPI001EE67517|nr:VWA domain-containing protein [Thermus parvatiensis]
MSPRPTPSTGRPWGWGWCWKPPCPQRRGSGWRGLGGSWKGPCGWRGGRPSSIPFPSRRRRRSGRWRKALGGGAGRRWRWPLPTGRRPWCWATRLRPATSRPRASRWRRALRFPWRRTWWSWARGFWTSPRGRPRPLRAYLHRGGGLLFTATPKGLFFGGWDRALPEELPLKPLGREGAALVLVLDVSGSMEGEKLALAVSAALALARTATPEDYLGVVVFASGHRVLFPPRPMTDRARKELETLLLSLRAGGGTAMGGALREAVRLLEGVPRSRKGVLVLTDGQVADDREALLALAERSGVEVSAIALGADADAPFLEALAQRGGGRFYRAASPKELPRLFLREGQEVFRGEALEGRFPVEARPHPLTEGFRFPPLSVLLPARAEPWAEVLLTSGERAVLAIGERGEGRVAALATDLSRSWRDFPEASAFLGGLFRWLIGARRALALYAYPEGEGVRVVALGPLEAPEILSGGTRRPMVPTGPLRFEARVEGEGVLLDRGLRLPLALPLPGEWSPRDGREVLRALAEASGGRLLAGPEEVSPGKEALPLRPFLVGLALALFLLERFLEARLDRAASRGLP